MLFAAGIAAEMLFCQRLLFVRLKPDSAIRSKRSVEVHRAHVMCKLGAENLIDLFGRAAAMGFNDFGTSGNVKRT